MSIIQVTTTTIINASIYNALQATTSHVLYDTYGYTTVSYPVTSGTKILAEHWLNLQKDIDLCRIHQFNTTTTVPQDKLPNVSDVRIFADYVNALSTGTGIIALNTQTHSEGQLALAIPVTGASESTRTAVWGSTLTHTVQYDWESTADAEHFFNLGGRLRLRQGYGPSTGTDIYSVAYMGMIDYVESQLSTVGQFTSTNYYNNVTINYTTASGILQVETDGLDHDIYTVEISKTSSTRITAIATLGHIGTNVPLDIISTATYYYSRNDATLFGILAPRPQVRSITWVGDAGAFVPFPTKVITVPYSPSTFTWHALKQSDTQTITLTNTGNASCVITDILLTANGGVTPHITYGGIGDDWGTFTATSVTIAAGASRSFTVYYTGTNVGTWSNSITVKSIPPFGNDRGDITIPVVQEVQLPLFEITVSPDAWTTSSSLPILSEQSFGITSQGYDIVSYSASLSYEVNFSVNSSSINGPIVDFNPAKPVLSTGTYSTVLTILATGTNNATSTTSIPISITYSQPQNTQLGAWLSPLSENNAVVGMNYNTAGGIDYLIVGVGVGADYSGDLSHNGIPNVDLNNLSYTSDDKPQAGWVLYPVPYNDGYCSFMNEYGAWIRYLNGGPTGFIVIRAFDFTVPRDGLYDWTFSCDFDGIFSIDGTIIGDLRNVQTAFSDVQTGTTTLPVGEHKIQFQVLNRAEGAGVAIKLVEQDTGIQIWSTKDPIRSKIPYKYWQDVYAIPLDQGKYTYRSGKYLIKNTQPALGNYWGSYFSSDGSLFTVTADGFGNLDIKFNGRKYGATDPYIHKTLINLNYLPYYYSTADTRYTQLEDAPIGDGTQTHYFLGFDRTGAVRTSIVPYPTTTPDYTVETTSVDNKETGPTATGDDLLNFVVDQQVANVIWTAVSNFPVTVALEEGVEVVPGTSALGNYFDPTGTSFFNKSLSEVTDFEAFGDLSVLEGVGILLSFVQGFKEGGVIGGVINAATSYVVGQIVTWAVVEAAPVIIEIIEVVAVGGGCFTDNTQIDLADDSQKLIKDIKVGDLVYNHDRTQVNQVNFIEYVVDYELVARYSPDSEHEPFATINHPLMINGELHCPNPEHNYQIYPWLGFNKKLQPNKIEPAKGELVYNLWVTGDGTYRVNGYGTHSIIGDGGALTDAVNDSIITSEQALLIFKKIVNYGNDTLYGTYLFNKYMGRVNRWVSRKLINILLNDNKYPKLHKTIIKCYTGIGKVTRAFKKLHNPNPVNKQ